MGLPVLVSLLPDLGLFAAHAGLRFATEPEPILQLVIAATAGALAACLWTSFAQFLLEMNAESKSRNIVVGAIGAAILGGLYILFEERVLEVHEFVLQVGKHKRNAWGPTPSDRHVILGLVGAIGAVIGLVVDRGLDVWR